MGDPAVSQHRAEALYELLEYTRGERESGEASGESAEYARFSVGLAPTDREYDAMDLAEIYELSESD